MTTLNKNDSISIPVTQANHYEVSGKIERSTSLKYDYFNYPYFVKGFVSYFHILDGEITFKVAKKHFISGNLTKYNTIAKSLEEVYPA